MTTVHEMLVSKGHGFIAVSPEEFVLSAMKKMADKDIGSLLVMNGGKLVGIFTERHYARKFGLQGGNPADARVRDMMEANVACIEPAESIETCMERMTRKRVRHLPVVDGGRVMGVVSIGDLLKSIIDEQRRTIHELEGYIARMEGGWTAG